MYKNQIMRSTVDGILGEFNRKAERPEMSTIQRLLDCMQHRRNGSDNTIKAGETVLAYANDQFSGGRDGHGLVISFHGVIDNAAELSTRCGNNENEKYTLQTLVAALYKRFGSSFPALIEGDFALVIWDQMKKELFCARDIAGLKPFNYYCDQKRFVWCSELKPLINHPDIRINPNEQCVVAHLLDQISTTHDTLYENIFRLPRGHSLKVTSDDLKIESYWHPENIKEIRYWDNDAYAGNLGELIEDAVRKCIGKSSAVGIFLSGGVDSSLLFGVAASQRNATSHPAKLLALSNIFPGHDCDESSYIKDVIDKWPCNSYSYTPEPQTKDSCLEQSFKHGGLPDYPNGAMSNGLLLKAKEEEIVTVLTGLGGDEWFQGSLFHFSDYLFALRLGTYFAEARRLSARTIFSLNRNSLLYYSISPYLPKWIKSLFRSCGPYQPYPAWVSKDLINTFAKESNIHERDSAHTQMSRARFLNYQAANTAFNVHAGEMEERSGASYGVEFRAPLFTRPIIEFALSLPLEQLYRDNKSKYVLRQSMKPYLPQSIYNRFTKTSYSSVIAQSIFSCKALFDETMEIEKAGWITTTKARDIAGKLERSYNVQHGNTFSKELWTLWSCIAIDCWYRTHF